MIKILESIIKRSQGRNLWQEPAGRSCSRDFKERCCMACSLWRTQFAFLHGPGLPAHSGWDSHPSVINQKKCTTDLPAHQFDGGIFSTEDPSSQMTLNYIKLTENSGHLWKPEADVKYLQSSSTSFFHLLLINNKIILIKILIKLMNKLLNSNNK